MPKSSAPRNLTRTILRWYRSRGRSLPWRNITNPYRILISEIMLQQTQVGRVLVAYPAFLRRFPSLRSLARAQQSDVVRAWRGLGYNNRAVRLHRFAQAVVNNHGGRIPRTFDALIALPGIGEYTAHALLSSAFGVQSAVVDVNIQRVFSRIFWRMSSTVQQRGADEIWKLARALLPHGKAYDWNQALMDLGALICTARNPKCDECPVASACASRVHMIRVRTTRGNSEPSYNGIPNRIYRGKIVERLRRLPNGTTIDANLLGRSILPSFGKKDMHWLARLLKDLEKDGLVRIAMRSSLPMQVSLA